MKLITTLHLFQVSIFLSGSFNDFTFSQYSFSAKHLFQVLYKAKGYLGLYERQISGCVQTIDLALPLAHCVALGQLLNRSEPQFHH